MTSRTVRRSVDASRVGLAVAVGSALLQLAPLLGTGYVLVRDMVFLPSPPLTGQLLGRDGVPRAVPSDLLTALLSHLLPGQVVQDLVLLAIVVLAGWGAARLVPGRSVAAAAAAALAYSWNPYLAERLRQGQWAVLLGYAALPWVATAAIGWRRGRRGGLPRTVLALGLAAAGGASAELLAALVLLPLAWWPGGAGSCLRRGALGVGALVLLALPWLVPALLQPTGLPPDRVGTQLFAARADTPYGVVGSLLSLGGIWNSQVVPAGRDSWLVGLAALALSAGALWALWRTRSRWRSGELPALVTAGLTGLLIAVWGAVPGARRLLADLVAAVSATGVLRDGQRWLAPFVLLVAVGFGLVVEQAIGRYRLAALLALAPALLLPAAAWGSDGALAAVSWPSDWHRVATATSTLPPGPVLVLPWSAVRSFGWDGGRALTDPAVRWLPRRVVGSDTLDVGGTSTPVEDPAARRIAAAAAGRGPLVPLLRREGYAGVLLEVDQPGAVVDAARLSSLRVVRRTPTLVLLAVPAPAGRSPRRAPLVPLLVAEALAGSLLVVAGFGAARNRPKKQMTV